MGYRVFSQMFVPLSRGLAVLTRIIHERFCCNRGFAAATSLDAVARRPGRRARRSVGQHTVSSMPPSLAAPRACLAWRLRDFATNRHESCGLDTAPQDDSVTP